MHPAMQTMIVRHPAAPQRRGAVLVLVAICMIVLIGMAALAFDFGYAYYATQQLQNAADSAAMAGAGKLHSSQSAARSAAIALAGANKAAGDSVLLTDNLSNNANGDVVLGVFSSANLTFTATTTSPNAVKVVARRTAGSAGGPVSTFFGNIFGFSSLEMTRSAIAVAEGGPSGPAILLLAPDGIGLQHSGNGTCNVLGTIQINSDYQEALAQSGNGTINSDSYDVVGKIYDSTPGTGLPGTWNQGADPMADPYASLPVPIVTDSINYPVRSSSKFTGATKTLWPGRYKGGIDLGGSTSTYYTFMPGIYIIEGGGFKISSPVNITADGVMIYNAGTNIAADGTLGTSGADQILLSADSKVNWTPPTSGTYKGFCIFQHRALSDKKVQISGNGWCNITGIVYAASAEVQLSGNGGTQLLGGGFVARRMQISGDGTFSVGGGNPGGGGLKKVYLAW
jgi:Flp pilus assembly protein TadG